jgi:hypothetical protein
MNLKKVKKNSLFETLSGILPEGTEKTIKLSHGRQHSNLAPPKYDFRELPLHELAQRHILLRG